MEKINYSDFISAISNELGCFCLFYKDINKAKKEIEILKKIKKKAPLLPLYSFHITESEENIRLCEEIEVPDSPVIIVFKDGKFSRYKNKKMSPKEIEKFIGSLKKFTIKEEEAV